MPPPPLYNDDDNSMETFQSCSVSTAAVKLTEMFHKNFLLDSVISANKGLSIERRHV